MTVTRTNPIYVCVADATHRFRSDTDHLVELPDMRFPPCPDCGGELKLEGFLEGVMVEGTPRHVPGLGRLANPDGYAQTYRASLAEQTKDWCIAGLPADDEANINLSSRIADTFAHWFCQCGGANVLGSDRCRHCGSRRKDCEDAAPEDIAHDR